MLKKTLALVGLTLSLTANTAVVTHGSLASDDSTNLITDSLNNVEYLMLDVIADLDYAQTQSILNTQSGGGWSIANASEGIAFTQSLLISSACTHDGTDVTNNFCGTIQNWTEGDFGDNQFETSISVWFIDQSGEADGFRIYADGDVYIFDLEMESSDYRSINYTSGYYETVSWLLIRPSEVPIPAAGWLFMTALMCLAGKKRLSRDSSPLAQPHQRRQ